VTGLHRHFDTFPPAFAENPWSYGFALFALVLMASVSMAQVVRQVRVLKLPVDGLFGTWSALCLWRLTLILIFSAFTLVTFPDVVVLLLWNEVTDSTMQQLWALDRFFDAMTLAPFVAASLILIRSEGHMTTQLSVQLEKPSAPTFPTWSQTLHQVKLFGIVAVIAAGVSIGKLGG
jgi:hypothetical protein